MLLKEVTRKEAANGHREQGGEAEGRSAPWMQDLIRALPVPRQKSLDQPLGTSTHTCRRPHTYTCVSQCTCAHIHTCTHKSAHTKSWRRRPSQAWALQAASASLGCPHVGPWAAAAQQPASTLCSQGCAASPRCTPRRPSRAATPAQLAGA